MKFTWRIWILILLVLFSLISIFSIPPTFMQKGVLVKSVEHNSSIFEQGLRQDDIIIGINNKNIETIEDYSEAMKVFSELDENETIRFQLRTKDKEIISLFSKEIVNNIVVSEIPKTRIKTGLDLQGGARALVTSEEKITEQQLDDLIDVVSERLNVYGLTDVQLRKISDLSGNKFMLVEIAGSSPSELEELIAKQGKFEAKIGNKTVFIGGNKDITFIGRSGQDAMIYDCKQEAVDSWFCFFRFSITLSTDAADNYANVTKEIPINSTNPEYLEKNIDFFLDDVLTSSLLISKDLKGNPSTQHSIQGSGQGTTYKEAIDNTKAEMKKLQSVLKTGGLSFKLKIEKIDRISPKLGQDFTKQILIAALFAILAVSILIFIRYRKIKISLSLISVSLSEVLMILGIASLINWNLDLPSIAGIIAAIGTGIDSQLIILDEARVKGESIKQKIKKALFIILTAFATTFVALIPLTGALSFMGISAVSAGLLKGFAIMTIIGLSVGVLISRPAFADIVGQMGD